MDFTNILTAAQKDIKFMREDVLETQTTNLLWSIDIENTIVDQEDGYRINNSRIYGIKHHGNSTWGIG